MTELEYSVSSGLYIDAENLQGGAQELIVNLLEDWSPAAPHPTLVVLYVRADMAELWTMWAHTNIKAPVVEVKGIQHFTAQQSKNSADIAIAVDAMADLLNGMVHHVTVFSDDSDFISLFAKIRTETKGIQSEIGRIPFLWVLTNRDGTKTPNIQQFFPQEYLHFVGSPTVLTTSATAKIHKSAASSANSKSSVSYTEIADTLIRELPVGGFASSDCKRIINDRYPKHSMASLGDAQFGTVFSNKVWTILRGKGVLLTKPKSPRRYEMTQDVKDSLN